MITNRAHYDLALLNFGRYMRTMYAKDKHSLVHLHNENCFVVGTIGDIVDWILANNGPTDTRGNRLGDKDAVKSVFGELIGFLLSCHQFNGKPAIRQRQFEALPRMMR